MSKLRLPKGVTYLQAYEAVAAKRLLSETDYGAYCRKNGLVNTTVEVWSKWFVAHPDACNSEDLQAERQLRVQAPRDAVANLNWYGHVRRGVSPLRQLNQGTHSGIVS